MTVIESEVRCRVIKGDLYRPHNSKGYEDYWHPVHSRFFDSPLDDLLMDAERVLIERTPVSTENHVRIALEDGDYLFRDGELVTNGG